MREPLWERIKQFICRYIGHRKDTSWEYNGQLHTTCKRCRRIYSVNIEERNSNEIV